MTMKDFADFKSRVPAEDVRPIALVAALRREVSPTLASAVADMFLGGHSLKEVKAHLRNAVAAAEAV